MQQNQGTHPQAQPAQNNVVDFDVLEIFPDESAEYYPVETKWPGRPRKNAAPYNKGKEVEHPRPRRRSSPEEVDKFNQEIQHMIEESNARDDEMEDEEESAPPKKTILKKSKTYNYNAWEDIKEWKIDMTLQ